MATARTAQSRSTTTARGDTTDDFVVYTPTGDYNGRRQLHLYGDLAHGVTEQATVSVTVTAVNDGPQFAGLNGTPTFTEDGSPVVLDSDALISDAELDAANNYNGATLTLARNGGASANDVFGATGLLSFSGGADGSVLYNFVPVGTLYEFRWYARDHVQFQRDEQHRR